MLRLPNCRCFIVAGRFSVIFKLNGMDFVTFSSDGKTVLSGDSGGTIYVHKLSE
jgi:hypothetical protein